MTLDNQIQVHVIEIRCETCIRMFFSFLISFEQSLTRNTYGLISLEKHHSTALISCGEVITCMIKLDSGNYVR